MTDPELMASVRQKLALERQAIASTLYADMRTFLDSLVTQQSLGEVPLEAPLNAFPLLVQADEARRATDQGWTLNASQLFIDFRLLYEAVADQINPDDPQHAQATGLYNRFIIFFTGKQD